MANNLRAGYFACEVCGECRDRRTNSQKYCDDCRQLATSRKVAGYYRRHRRKLLKRKAAYRAANREAVRAQVRLYHQETKGERRTRAELRQMRQG